MRDTTAVPMANRRMLKQGEIIKPTDIALAQVRGSVSRTAPYNVETELVPLCADGNHLIKATVKNKNNPMISFCIGRPYDSNIHLPMLRAVK